MPWFKVDDTLAFHAKVVAAGNEAMGLWVRAGSWSSQQLTDGFIPDHMIAAMGGGEDRLIEVGLWTREEGGCRFHEWEQAQFTRAEIESRRAYERDRKRKQRRTPQGQFTDNDGSPNGVPAGHPTGQGAESRRESHRPVPSRPDPDSSNEESSERPRKRGARGTRLSPDWQPSQELVEQMRAERPGVDLEAEHRKFVDHFIAAPGQKGVKVDWSAAWRNWMRRAHEFSPTKSSRRENTLDAWSTPAEASPQMEFIDGEVVELRRALP